MNAIALCHNRDLQKTNGRIIVLGTGSISLMQTATWVNMQPYSQSKWFVLHLDYVMVCLSVCLSLGLLARVSACSLLSQLPLNPSVHPPFSPKLSHSDQPIYPANAESKVAAPIFFSVFFFFVFLKQAAKPAVFFSIQHASQRRGPCFVVCWL